MHMQHHRSLERVDGINSNTRRDPASIGLLDRSKSFPIRKKSQVTNAPSLQAVTKTAPNARRLGDTVKTLVRWNGSIYKYVWRHMLLYYLFYITLTVIYKFLLDDVGQRHFEALSRYFSKSASTLNLMIMLGFFTSATLQRLFTMQTSIPGTARIISSFVMSLKANLPEGSIIVHQYARWTVLSWFLAVRSVSRPLRNKYPNMISLQTKGVLLPRERLILERAETEGDPTPRPLVVIDWMLLLLKECSTHSRYNNKSCHHKNVELLMAFKKSCGNMIKFATKNVPHCLIQAVIIAVYYFGLVTMLARDLSSPKQNEIVAVPNEINEILDESYFQQPPDGGNGGISNPPTDIPYQDELVKTIMSYFPIMPFMQFFIFFAWLTFGRMAVNPFGDDETDIDLDELLEAHIDDYRRLGNIYKCRLEDVFPDLPQRRFNECSSSPRAEGLQVQTFNFPKSSSSPNIELLAVRSARPNKSFETTVDIDAPEETQLDDMESKKSSWKIWISGNK